MGEVYRADDLKLGQSVALKFLPEAFARDEDRRERFLAEVRIARQIAHPNVCRIYDVGEVDHTLYLSMEFVDGDNLATLLRRVGRLPEEKGVEIARQLCAGLSAAHDKGVLHRDLKPENIMIDGRGKVRVADFGLAAVAEAVINEDVRSGTPAYMSPEQLAGRGVTAKSDLYALGLILFELFTGKRAFNGTSFLDFLRGHENEPPPPPSSLVADIDPSIERAILRCLEKDPLARPANALSVAISLPGGDPLAAAIAAGETPSPELVAAAGGVQYLRRSHILGAAAILAIAAVSLPFLAAPSWLTTYVAMPKAAAVLEDKAREIVRELKAPDRYADHASGFLVDGPYLQEIQKNPAQDRWETLRKKEPPVLMYWYRESPRTLLPFNTTGVVFSNNPPALLSGMVRVTTDMEGRLVVYQRVPPQKATSGESDAAPFDWSRAFRLAGLRIEDFKPVSPEWIPPFGFDARAAWTGSFPSRPEIPMRIEAASFQGVPVAFQTVAPWDRPTRMEPYEPTTRQIWAQRMGLSLLFLFVLGTFVWAYRAYKSGRADVRGASRLALTLLALSVVTWLLQAQHSNSADEELQIFVLGVSVALLVAAVIGVAYAGLEPLARRICPERLVSWTRLLTGRWTDPLVAGHALIGAAIGATASVLANLPLEALFGMPVADLSAGNLDAMASLSSAIPVLINRVTSSVITPISCLLLLISLEQFLKRRGMAFVITVAAICIPASLQTTLPFWIGIPWVVAITALPLFALYRFGVVAGLMAFAMLNLPGAWPLTKDLSVWWSIPTRLTLAVFALTVFYGLRYGLAPAPSAASPRGREL